MEVRLLALVSYWVSSATLGAWLLEQAWALIRRVGALRFRNPLGGRKLFIIGGSQVAKRKSLLLSTAGMVMGGFAVSWLEWWVSAEGLLLLLVAIVVCALEFNRSGSEVELLSVLTLIQVVRTRCVDEGDLFELLTNAIGTLPEGKVQKALREAVFKRRSGNSASESLDALKGIHACLDEFILTLRLLNGKAGPALVVALDRLSVRAGRQWDWVSRWLVFKEQARNFTRFIRASALAGIAWLLLRELREISVIWPSREVLFVLVWMVLVSSLALILCKRIVWLRRFLMIAILVFVFGMPNRAFLVRLPGWIQVQEVTHQTTTVDKRVDHPSASGVLTLSQPITGYSRVVSGLSQSGQSEIDHPLSAGINQHSAKPGEPWSLKPLRRQ